MKISCALLNCCKQEGKKKKNITLGQEELFEVAMNLQLMNTTSF